MAERSLATCTKGATKRVRFGTENWPKKRQLRDREVFSLSLNICGGSLPQSLSLGSTPARPPISSRPSRKVRNRPDLALISHAEGEEHVARPRGDAAVTGVPKIIPPPTMSGEPSCWRPCLDAVSQSRRCDSCECHTRFRTSAA